jgi:hypothetical protein
MMRPDVRLLCQVLAAGGCVVIGADRCELESTSRPSWSPDLPSAAQGQNRGGERAQGEHCHSHCRHSGTVA